MYILSMLLGASLLGNMLAGKGFIRTGEGTARADYAPKRSSSKEFQIKLFLIQAHPLTNFEIQTYYRNEPRFNGIYSRDNLLDKIKDGTNVINLDEYSDIETHWVALYVNNKTATYFDSF